MRPILAALLLALSAAAHAQTWLTASLGSYHFARKDYCEVNPGVGFEHAIAADLRFIAGSYQNSYCRASSYLGASYVPLRLGAWRAGAALLAVTGYEVDRKTKKDKLIIVPLPTLAYEGARLGVNLVMLPPREDFKGGIGLQLKVRFW